ncbi:hypothetical protein F5X99DRAFT_259901 [Biscogniauxia marginata]|nr:hypothetical protein F5X99DRAFT_259901 [Biscogniauxia marginata]
MWSFGTTMTMAKDEPPASPSASEPARPSPAPQTTTAPIAPLQPRPPVSSQRSLKQLGLFFAGAGLFTLSTLITRRAVARKQIATIPKFYQQSNGAVGKISSDNSLIAFEALNLATLNALSFAIMATGGVAWAFDISNIDDLRRKARRHIESPGGKIDEEAEQEIEEWVAKILMRKEKKEQEQEAKSSGEKG